MALQADLQMVTRDKSGHNSTFTSNGKQARIDDNQNPGYILIDQQNNRIGMVDPQRREVLDMGPINDGQTVPMNSGLSIKLEKQGNGPKIAGYKTKKFDIQVNGRHCGTVYGSRKAMKNKGIEQIFKAMATLQQQSSSLNQGFRSLMDGRNDECDRAELEMNKHFKTSGVPMRILDRNSQLQSEVIKFNTKTKLPPDYYTIPKDFKVTNMQQKMNEAQQQMQQHMPDMNQLMQQMQQDQQGLPPEAMEQMKKMQDLFKQQFQQQ